MSEQEKISQIVQELLLHAGEFPKRDLSAIGRYVYNRERDLERQLSEARKENENLRECFRKLNIDSMAYADRTTDKITAYQSAFGKVREVAETLREYAEHGHACILSYFHQGRPTADGGYEVQYGDKWYQSQPIDQTPKCQCGLDDALTLLSTLNAQDAPQPGQGVERSQNERQIPCDCEKCNP